MDMEILKEQLYGIIPDAVFSIIKESDVKCLREVRMRAGKNIILITDTAIYKTDLYASKEDIISVIQTASCSSVYAFVDEIKNGFITLKGGHRIGICGRAVVKKGEITNIVDFSGINIRIAKEITGCAEKIYNMANGESVLIISPPGCGKTTMLRDFARILGAKNNVCIVDERGEIAAVYRGVPQFDVGLMTDVLDLCPKKEGIELVLRGMSPQYIITDEIGKNDLSAVNKGLLCGAKFILSAHGDNIADTLKRLEFEQVADKFGCIVAIGKNGVVTERSLCKERAVC